MRSGMKILGLMLLAVTLPPGAAHAADAPPFPPRGKLIFSDLCAGPELWAVHGHRIVFEYDENGYDLSIDFSDKGFDSDVLHSPRVLFDPATGALQFYYVDFSDEYGFSGFITSRELTGFFDDDLASHTLPRVPNTWPEKPPCQPQQEEEPEFPE
jgi:hypothetical protein